MASLFFCMRQINRHPNNLFKLNDWTNSEKTECRFHNQAHLNSLPLCSTNKPPTFYIYTETICANLFWAIYKRYNPLQ